MIKKEYALYKGEELLSIGTITEIAKEMGVQKDTIRYLKTPTYQRRLAKRKNGKFEKQRSLVLIED